MDLVTQGVLGAAFAQNFSKKKSVTIATIAGFLGGLGADADVFIRSSIDPLLSIEFHRHFTHSLIFIPIGALITAFITWLILRRRDSFREVYYFSFLGYATHALLDACTSYGTRLYWPFSNVRIAWDNVAIVDLFFTLPLLVAMIWTLKTKNIRVVQLTLVFAFSYLWLGTIQRDRAINYAKIHAEAEGRTPITIQAKPTLGQLILFKTIYTYKNTDGKIYYYVDAVRLGIPPLFDTKFYPGQTAAKLDLDEEFSDLDQNSVLYKDIIRFNDFSSNMLVRAVGFDNVIGDARYSLLPNSLKSLWGIEVDKSKPNEHVKFMTFRKPGERDLGTLWSMIKGTYTQE